MKDYLLIGGIYAFLAVGIAGPIYLDRQRSAKIEPILQGEIRGNKESLIFHVPTCPDYNSISERNLRKFATVADAEAANYRPSRNCLEAVSIREINETEINEGPEGGYDDPRY